LCDKSTLSYKKNRSFDCIDWQVKIMQSRGKTGSLFLSQSQVLDYSEIAGRAAATPISGNNNTIELEPIRRYILDYSEIACRATAKDNNGVK
jgi:hypothetical protein